MSYRTYNNFENKMDKMRHHTPAVIKKSPALVLPALVLILFCGLMLHAQDNRAKEVYDTPEKMQTRLLDYINKERTARGSSVLSDHQDLGTVAKNHSSKMAFEKKLSHTFPSYPPLSERLRQAGIFFMKYGENVAYSETPVSTLIHKELMLSPEHRENILDPEYTHCAVRVVNVKGKYYVTQNFATLYTPIQAKTVKTMLKSQVSAWVNKPLISHPLWDEFAGEYSHKKLQNVSMKRLVLDAPSEWGKFYAHYLLTPDIEKAKSIIKEKISKLSLAGLGVGVAFVRNEEYPGGAYSLSFLFFSNPHLEKSPGQLAQTVLNALNKKRRDTGLAELTLDKKGSAFAMDISRKTYDNPGFRPQLPAAGTQRQIYFYQTGQLDSIPVFVINNMTSVKRETKSIGIGVFCPLKIRRPGNYFLVTLLVK